MIKKIIIENFRIFKGKHEFELGNHNILIINGPNGHGKSTFFDSISWCLTGVIDRYTGDREYQKFNYLINNTAILEGDRKVSVTLDIENGEEIFSIKRLIVNDVEKIEINGDKKGVREGQRMINSFLLKENINVDLRTYISSTKILSQESLNAFVRSDKPTERFTKVEEILGLNKYGIEFKEYLNILKKQLKDRIEELEKISNATFNELERCKIKYNENEKYLNKEYFLNLNSLANKSVGIIKNKNNLNILKNVELDEESLRSVKDILMDLENKKFELTLIKNSMVDYLKLNQYNELVIGLKKERSKTIENKNSIIKEIENDKKLLDKLKLVVKLESSILKKQNNNNELIEKAKTFNINEKELEKYENKYLTLKKEESIIICLLDKANLETKEKSIDRTIEKLSQELEVISKNIENNNIEIKKADKNRINQKDLLLNETIADIQETIKYSNSDICLICGTKFESNEILVNALDKQLDLLLNKLDQEDKKIIELNQEKQKLILKNNSIEDEIKYLKDEKEDLIKKLQELNKNIYNSIDLYSLKLNQLTENELVDKKNNINKNINKDLYLLSKMLNENKVDISDKIDILNEIKSEINDLKNIDIQSEKISSRILNYEMNLDILNTKIESISIEMNDIENIIEKIQINWDKYINITYMDKNANINKFNDLICNDINQLMLEIDLVKEYISTIDSSLNIKKIRDLESKINYYKEIYEKQNNHRIVAEKAYEDILALIKSHSLTQSHFVESRLYILNDAINNFFRQISPHSYFNYINLLIEENNLHIMIDEDNSTKESNCNASLTFSSAQLTVLAISIFIALNLSTEVDNLNLIAIDDPFQNLDDINIYSFIDVLENIAIENKKQIFISTHNQKFAKLIYSKLDSERIKIKELKFISYTSNSVVYEFI